MNEHSLRQHAEDFVVYKRTLGYVYDSQEGYLKKYVDFVERCPFFPNIPTKRVTDEYIGSISSSNATLYGTVSVLREFSRYLRVRGFDAYIIPPKTVRQPVAEEPYFFMPEEIEAFFGELDKIEPHKSFKGRELVFPALFCEKFNRLYKVVTSFIIFGSLNLLTNLYGESFTPTSTIFKLTRDFPENI